MADRHYLGTEPGTTNLLTDSTVGARLGHRPSCGLTPATRTGLMEIETGLRLKEIRCRMIVNQCGGSEVASSITAATSLSLMPPLTHPHRRPRLHAHETDSLIR